MQRVKTKAKRNTYNKNSIKSIKQIKTSNAKYFNVYNSDVCTCAVYCIFRNDGVKMCLAKALKKKTEKKYSRAIYTINVQWGKHGCLAIYLLIFFFLLKKSSTNKCMHYNVNANLCDFIWTNKKSGFLALRETLCVCMCAVANEDLNWKYT